jgi:3-isopropylmalate/(R)-2-methylmalate dehydratase large subunit
MRITIEEELGTGVEAKDVALALIAQLGAAGAAGHAVEYGGAVVRAMDMEARMTLCNLSVEMGATLGLVAPDETTLAYVRGTPNAPQGVHWTEAAAHWRTLRTDPGAVFDREVLLAGSTVAPQASWGPSPEQTLPLDAALPCPEALPPAQRSSIAAALDYMGLAGGMPLSGTPVDHVFIGSCANGRLSDLRRAAQVVRGHRVDRRIKAWVVPGSQAVKRRAEAEGLSDIFQAAGFEWRAPGCSMCVGVNGEILQPGQRCVSTSNRNFVGRQGPGVRTHLAGAAVAARAALLGHIPSRVEMAG